MSDFNPDALLKKLSGGSAAPAAVAPGFDPDALMAKLGSGAAMEPGSTPDSPVTTDVFGSDTDRTAASFGNMAGIANLLAKRGYVGADKNSAGDMVFKTPNGQWHKDANGFRSHPINWLESKTGTSLPLLGGMAGGMMGGTAAGIPSLGLGSAAGGMAGAAAGAVGGEALRQTFGRLQGTYDAGPGESAKDLALESAVNSLGEGVGQTASHFAGPYLKAGAEAAGNTLKKGVAGASSIMTGVPPEAIERLIERPSQVLAAGGKGAAYDIANNANQELEQRNALELGKIAEARALFREKYGQEPVNTADIIQAGKDFLQKYSPNSEGYGALSQGERRKLTQVQQDNLLTSRRSQEPDPDAYSREPVLSQKAIDFPDIKASRVDFQPSQRQWVPDGDFSPVESVPNPMKEAFPYAKIPETKIVPSDNAPVGGGDWRDAPPKVIPGEEYVAVPGTKSPTFEGWKNSYTEKSAEDLHKYADWLNNQITQFEQSRLPGSGDTRFQSQLRQEYGRVKDALHQVDPEGLGAADQRYSYYASHAKNFGRLEDPMAMEGFINNLYGKNKTALQQSAQELIPNSLESVRDMAADRAFTAQGPAGSEMGRRSVGAIAAGAGIAGASHGSPGGLALGAATALSTSPQLHKQIIGRTSQVLQAFGDSALGKMFANDPELIHTVANPELRSKLMEMFGGQNMSPAFADRTDKNQGGPLDSYGDVPEGRNQVNRAPVSPQAAQQKFLEGN